MKKTILLLAAFMLLIAPAIRVVGQGNPFTAKSKTSVSGSFMPAGISAIPGIMAGQARTGISTTFYPVTRPFTGIVSSGIRIDEIKRNSGGEVIFLSGRMKGSGNFDHINGEVPAEACFAYLNSIRNELRISDASREFRIMKQHTDDLGMTHVRMQQVCEGIPVFGSELYLHARGNEIELFNGHVHPDCKIPAATPVIESGQASITAREDLCNRTICSETDVTWQSLQPFPKTAAELVIYPAGREREILRLAWHITLRPNFYERWEYFIDAMNGDILHHYNNTHRDGDVTATGPDLNGVNRTIHCYLQGTGFLMVDVSRPMYNAQNQEGTLRVYDANYTSPSAQGFNPALSSSTNNTWGPKVISAQYNATVTYEYFRTNHGKNSWNNQGGSILSVINATENNGSGMDNAYWNGICVVYGNGATAFKPLQGGMDVVAHELGHAYIEGSANLEYQNQSGALNEAYADIAAAVVERVNWKIGEDVVKPGIFPGGCLRDMSNPHNGGTSLNDPGYQPAHVSEMYTGSDDNGGVHINSGIINFAFYKFVASVGMAKGEKVFYRALFNYLTRSSQFIDCRLAVIQSAKDLYGDGSAEVNAARTAFDEVGVTDGSGGNYQNPLPVNPGPDYILSYDMVDADPNTLYVCSTVGTDYYPLSQTGMICKPSVVDNGSAAVFIGQDKKMHSISLNSPFQEMIIQDQAMWSNVAISKDGSMIAAVTEYQDSAIFIYSFEKGAWAKAHLYNPTTQQGLVTNNVLYADALEWDYSGEYIMYDAYNQMNSSSTGQNVDYWDISFLRAWDKSQNDWGDGTIFKMVSGIPEGISIGNPSLSKNSPSVCAFDYFDETNGSVSILAANLESGDFVEVFGNGTQLGYPNYSKLDNKIIFTAYHNSANVVAEIAMTPDKIHPASTTATLLIPDAKWGVWFAQGERTLGCDEAPAAPLIRLYPNPAREIITLDLPPDLGFPATVQLYDSRGRELLQTVVSATGKFTIEVGDFPRGLCLARITGANSSGAVKVLLR